MGTDERFTRLIARHAKSLVTKGVGQEFGHMMEHIGQIERRMVAEIALINRCYPEIPRYKRSMKFLPTPSGICSSSTGIDIATDQDMRV